MAANEAASSHSPPSTALPQLPVSKLRGPSSRFSPSAQSSSPTTSLRTPSRLVKPNPTLNPAFAASSPNLPALQPTAPTPHPVEAQESSSPDKAVRRSVSIANFPEPPKARRHGESKRGSAGSMAGSERGADRDSKSNSLRIKKLKTKASAGSLGQAYRAGAPPSMLNGRGDSQLVPGLVESSGFTGTHSPPHSRSSSAQGSYSTSATTFEEPDEKRISPGESGDRKRGRNSGSNDKETKGNVIVSIRVRPDASGDKTSARDWLVDGRQSLVSFRGREGGDYQYDNVFAPYDKNRKVYDSTAKRLVHRVMDGFHAVMFAYGMTGTGKTFSMQGTTDSPGVIPLAVADIFSYIRETPGREFLLRVSYLEIYNEKIHDLLSPPATGAPAEEIKLREDNKRGVFAFPLKEEIVQSPTQLIRVIARGDQSRKTRSTQYNAQSSRSHAVVQIVVESRERAVSGKSANDKRAALMPGGVRVSTLSLIDLAGSERAAESKERRAEGAHINKSLLTLGTVVSRLSGDRDANGNPTDKEGKHLPYRDSKLTRLLQPALSGNSLVSILCTIQIGSAGSVAGASGHTGETLNTLKFAARARNNIVSHAKKAEEAYGATGDGGSGVLLARYQREIQDLKAQLEAQKKEQDRNVEEVEMEPQMPDHQRHEEQILEMHLARTALTRRMEDLRRLIIDSRSSGVNSSKISGIAGSSSHHKSESSTRTIRSLRSSASRSTLGTATPSLSRDHSIRSNTTVGPRQSSEQHQSPGSSPDIEEEDEEEDLGDRTASSDARIQALQSDLAEKNRYISTLEKRLLQARRSSQSRTSLLLSPRNFEPLEEESSPDTALMLKEKDHEIADLRARLDDKERMVNALRSAARHRDNADPSSPPPPGPASPAAYFTPPKLGLPHRSPNAPITTVSSNHQSNSSSDSSNSHAHLTIINPIPAAATIFNTNTTPPRLNTTSIYPKPSTAVAVSPVALLSPHKEKPSVPMTSTSNLSPATDRDREDRIKRKSIDEMTKILDGMISDRVQTGNLIVGANGIIKPAAYERRKESEGLGISVSKGATANSDSNTNLKGSGHGSVPSVGALAAQLRPMSMMSDIGDASGDVIDEDLKAPTVNSPATLGGVAQ